jgi:hypothetical protein
VPFRGDLLVQIDGEVLAFGERGDIDHVHQSLHIGVEVDAGRRATHRRLGLCPDIRQIEQALAGQSRFQLIGKHRCHGLGIIGVIRVHGKGIPTERVVRSHGI